LSVLSSVFFFARPTDKDSCGAKPPHNPELN
jgi:hypothetical protein